MEVWVAGKMQVTEQLEGESDSTLAIQSRHVETLPYQKVTPSSLCNITLSALLRTMLKILTRNMVLPMTVTPTGEVAAGLRTSTRSVKVFEYLLCNQILHDADRFTMHSCGR